MKYQDKTRDELLVMYLKLETEYQALKNLHQRDGTAYVVSERSTELSRIEFPDGDDNRPNEFLLANRSKLLSDETAGHKHLKEKLKESEEHFRNVFEQSIVGTSITTIDGRLQTNKAFCDILGYSNNELNNKSWKEITHPEDINANREILNSILAGDTKAARWEKRYFHKNGNIIWVDVNTSLHRGKKGEPLYFITSILDITEQKKAEQELLNAKEKAEENEKFNRLVADNLVNGMIYQVVILDNNQRKFTYLSDSVTKFYGCSVEEALDDPNLIYGKIYKDDIGRLQNEENAAIEKMAILKTELRLVDPNGNIRWSSLVSSPRMYKGMMCWDGIEIDITDRKQVEIRLSESQGLLNSIIDSTSDLIWSMDAENFTLVHWNLSFQKHFSELRGIEIGVGDGIEALFPENPKYIKIWTDLLNRALEEGSFSVEYESCNGDMIALLNFNLLIHDGKTTGISVFSKNITDQKLAEIKLQKANRLYNVVSHVSQTIVHVKSRDQLFEEVCRVAVEYGNFRMAWIGLIDEKDHLIKPFTFAGHEEGYLGLINQLAIEDDPEGPGLLGRAIRAGKNFVCNDFENDPNEIIWRDELLKRNYLSSIGLPIKLFGQVVGVFSIYASVRNFFDEEEIELLSEVAREISYAIEALEIEQKHNLAVSSLSVNEKKYREITESIKDVVWVLDAETMHFLYVSPSVEKLRGYTAEEVMALPISDAIKNEYREGVFSLVKTQISEFRKGNISPDKYFSVEIEQPCKDGSFVFTEVVAYLIINELSGNLELHGLTRDITDRKRTEESLRISEERFHGIFNNLQDAFFQADLSGNITLASPSAAKMYGYDSVNDMVGVKAANLYAYPEARVGLMNEIVEHGSVIDYQAVGKKKDGTTFWASMNVQYRYENGKIAGTEGVVRDITERKIQEDKINTLSSAIEQSPVMVVITDINGFIEYVNPKFCLVTGYTPEEVIGKNVRILKSAGRTREADNELWDCILKGKDWHGEFENLKKSGEIYYESASISPIKDTHGNIQHFISVKEDITEKKQLIRDLIKAKNKAEESDRLKSAFLANMSHEIRTPMNGILGFIELLKEPNLTGTEQKAYIQVIEESGDRMLNLMNNLIDISRIESEEIKVLNSSFNIRKQLDNIFNFFVPEANKKGLKLVLNCKLSPSESMIKTDMQKFDSILINLVKNAIKFTRNGSVEIGCSRQGDNFRFFVKDTGVGIDPGYQEIIFDRFRQASESLSRPYEGAGLGLSISKSFIESLGGKIWVESEVGKGSTFHFILPGDIMPADGISLPGVVNSGKAQKHQKELKVLIVEDDETSMNYMEIIAGSFCNNFITARTGLEAVKILRSNQDINLILMDIKMPVMDGLEATRQIRQFNKDVIIIAQTAYSMIGDKEKALEAGCNDYISKPVNKEQLRELVLSHAMHIGQGHASGK